MQAVAFHTKDAVQVDGSKFTFDLSHLKREGKVKCHFASCEFPLSQRSIEEGRNRIYFNHGHVIEPHSNISMEIDGETFLVHIPPRMNKVVELKAKRGGLEIMLASPHGFVKQDHFALCKTILIGGKGGDLPLTDATVIDSHTIHWKVDPKSQGASVAARAWDAFAVVTMPIASPIVLCNLLSSSAQNAGAHAYFTYIEESDSVNVKVRNVNTRVSIKQTQLAESLGLPIGSANFYPENNTVVINGTATRLWSFFSLSPGIYSPSHRPLSCGKPIDFNTEFEKRAAPLYFAENASLVFAAPATCKALIPKGRYNAEYFCKTVSDAMSASVPGAKFKVKYEGNYFTFGCTRDDLPAEFSLLFNHPDNFDATRIGFLCEPLFGSSQYTSTYKVQCGTRLLRCNEISSQKRFVLHCAQIPELKSEVINEIEQKRICECKIIYRTDILQETSCALLPKEVVVCIRVLFCHPMKTTRQTICVYAFLR